MEKYITIAVDVLSGIFCILFLLFGCLGYSHSEFNNDLVAPYKTNWNLNPLASVFSVSKDECPSGYTPLFSTTFPGNKAGCDCSKSNKKKYKNKVFKNMCEEEHIINGCTIIPERNETEITKWKGKTLCASRITSITYSDITSGPHVKVCPRGTRQCGFIDTENNLLCIDTAEPCPLNYLEILPDGQKPIYTKNINGLPLNGGYTLYVSNEVTSNPVVVDITISDSPSVCAHPYEGLLGENKYKLNKRKGPDECKTKINSFLTDWRFSQIDSGTRKDFYEDNDIDTIIAALPEYPPIDNSLIGVNHVNYFGIKSQCFNGKFDPNGILEPNIEILQNENYAIVVTCVLQLIYVFGVVIAFKIMMKFKLSNLLIIVIDIIQFLFLILIFGIALGISLNVHKITEPYSIFEDNQCADELTLGVFKMAYKPLDLTNKFLITLYGLSAFEIGVKIIYYVWYYLIRKN